jgi:hypothetical protein
MTREPTGYGRWRHKPDRYPKKRKDAAATDLVHHRGTLVEGWPRARGEDEGWRGAKAAASGAQRETRAVRDPTHPPHDVSVSRTTQPWSGWQ